MSLDQKDPTAKPLPTYTLKDVGQLVGHGGWVTAIASTADPTVVVSSSRDKTLIVWRLSDGGETFGKPHKRLYGHEHFVEDVAVSSDGRFALSGSWDKTLRLWDLETRECSTRFVHHSGDVLSVSFSADNRQICSGSRDRSVVLWNTLGQKNFTLTDKVSPDWISCVAFSPKKDEPLAVETPEKPADPETAAQEEAGEKTEAADKAEEGKQAVASADVAEKGGPAPETGGEDKAEAPKAGEKGEVAEATPKKTGFNFLVYASWNGELKKFDLGKLEVERTFEGHDGPVTALAISPDASLCASGGKDGRVLLWDLKSGQRLRELDMGGAVTALKFNPGRYWLCGASEGSMRVWDLVRDESEQTVCGADFVEQGLSCSAVEWGCDGETLMCGFTDGVIRALRVVVKGSDAPAADSPASDYYPELSEDGDVSGKELAG